jgi:hypothetical protein
MHRGVLDERRERNGRLHGDGELPAERAEPHRNYRARHDPHGVLPPGVTAAQPSIRSSAKIRASAMMVCCGFTPRFVGITDASQTTRPS